MVNSITGSISAFISRLTSTERPANQDASVPEAPSLDDLADQLDLSDTARLGIENDLEALRIAQSIPSQLQQSSIEFDQQRLGNIRERLDLLSDVNSPANEGLLNELTNEVVSIARRSLELSDFGLTSTTQDLSSFLEQDLTLGRS